MNEQREPSGRRRKAAGCFLDRLISAIMFVTCFAAQSSLLIAAKSLHPESPWKAFHGL